MQLKEACILVVDDSSVMRRVIRKFLTDMGARHIEQAENGKKAWHILQQEKVDLVICDWNMPRMKGVDLLEKVRSYGPLSRLPFIMVTAEGNRKFISEAVDKGVDDYITKPFGPADLGEKIRTLFEPAP